MIFHLIFLLLSFLKTWSVPFLLLQTEWLINNNKIFTCHSSGGWTLEIRMPACSGEALFQWQTSLCILPRWKGLGTPVGSLIRALIPNMGVPPLGPNHLPRALPSNTITLGTGFSSELLETRGDYNKVLPKSLPSSFCYLIL